MINLKDSDGNKIDEPCDYHDVNLLYLFDRGKTVSKTVNLIQQVDFYLMNYLIKNLEATLSELHRREQNLDIYLADFITQNYQKEKLFHTINHPSLTILNYLGKEILNFLNLPTEDLKKEINEVLDFTDFPIYPAVACALKLDFATEPKYRIRGEILNLKQAVELFFDFYQANRELVKLNIIRHQEKYAATVCGIQVSSTQIFALQIPEEIDNDFDNTNGLLDCLRQQTFQDLLDLAEQHCNNNLKKEAIALCQAALKIDPQSIQAWRQLAHSYEAQGDLKAAVKASDRAVAIDPRQADSNIHQARLLELQGKTFSAKKLYQEAISLDAKQPPWVYRHLGNVLIAEDNPLEAIIAYKKAIALNPDFGAQIYLSLAEAYQQQKQWQQAQDTYTKALDINPNLQDQIAQKIEYIARKQQI